MIDWHAEQSDKFIGTAAAIASLIAAGASTAGTVYAAHKAGDTAKDAAEQQLEGVNHAAELTKQSNDAAEAFSRQQAENEYQNTELTRHANYDQYKAQRSRLGTLGAMLGLPAPEIPDYVPSQDPRFTNGSAPAPGAAPAAPSQGGSDPVTQAILDNYKALGVAPTGPGTGPTDIAYMVGQAKSSLASGERPLSYWLGPNGRIAQELAKAKGGTLTAATAAPKPSGTLAAMAAPYQVANPTAPLAAKPYDGTLIRFGA